MHRENYFVLNGKNKLIHMAMTIYLHINFVQTKQDIKKEL
jgi:hypothetical protein